MNVRKEDFSLMVELYRDWNEKINVISRKDTDNIFEHHILHSLCVAKYLEECCGVAAGDAQWSFFDIGTGGGFPGIPMAAVMPLCSFTLCDSIGKKIKVAGAVAEGLGLKNVQCINARAESVDGVFDWVVSRAVTSLDNFYPWAKGRYDKGIICLKGGEVEEEIALLCRKFRLDRAKIHVWSIDNWLKDEYFSKKFVIHIEK